MLRTFGLKKGKIAFASSDPPSVAQAEPPELHGLIPPGAQSHHKGAIELGLRFHKFQIKIPGAFLFLVAQKIVFHITVLTAEGIQSIRTKIAIQHKGNKALGGDGFARTVFATKQKPPIAEGKFLPVIQPKIDKPQFVHLPAFLHTNINPPVTVFSDKFPARD